MAVVEPQFYAELKYSDEAEYDAAASGYREHQSDEQAESLNDGVPYFATVNLKVFITFAFFNEVRFL